jgi:hypothetical protein
MRERTMSSDDTMKVLERHGAAVQTNDLDAVMADDAHNAVLISPRHSAFGDRRSGASSSTRAISRGSK